MYEYGLTEDVLLSNFTASEAQDTLTWKLKVVPKVKFYKLLHLYMKKEFPNSTKGAIGKFYIAIDDNLKTKGSRPDNIYRFIERAITSKRLLLENPMEYGLDMLHRREVKVMKLKLAECNEEIEELTTKCSQLKDEFTLSKEQLKANEKVLNDAVIHGSYLEKRFDASKGKLKSLEEKCAKLKDENSQLFNLHSDIEECTPSNSSDPLLEQAMKPTCKYSPEIRKLYYSLLAQQIPASKVESIIRSVLKCFHPTLDSDNLSLPKKTCASYMRREELKTITNAHKATILSTETSEIKLNTDGTTKNQKKLGGVVVNDMVLSINELCDGTAASAVTDISEEFAKLRDIARVLGLNNPNSINWTLVAASTSDSAATQKKLNKLIEECRQKDLEKFGPATVDRETIDLVETFCAMHLGVNLRKSFLSGLSDESSEAKHHTVDVLVHEFSKFFGKHGVPEYGSGLSFSDFLAIMTENSQVDLSEAELTYYQNCSTITLHRQIGSRYFVSSSNGCKILFLKDAALSYFKFTAKNKNNLEQAVFAKLQDELLLCQVMADCIMYYHVYADLVMLSKSNILGKSAFTMNQHYYEIQNFLTAVIENPEIVLNSDYHVFSEAKLYSDDQKTNHRLRSSTIYDNLFDMCKDCTTTLYPLLINGADSMREKLCTYAHSQLPGGEYWDPEPQVKNLLCCIKPSNDVCESILGLNDYLTTAIPNLHQMARSNLIAVKKNKTLSWLSEISEKEQHAVINLAVKQRRQVFAETKQKDKEIAAKRREKMLKANWKRKALEKKLSQEKEELLELDLITTSGELYQSLDDIEFQGGSLTAIKSKKLFLLKTQVKMRRKLLNEKVPITFTCSGKQKSISYITKELSDYIDEKTSNSEYHVFLRDPRVLVGRKIEHKFNDECQMMWYTGTVVDYCSTSKTHEILYDDEDEKYNFDLIIDLINGDLIII